MALQLCIVEDSPEALEFLLAEFKRQGVNQSYCSVQTEEAFVETLKNVPCDVILANRHLSRWNSMKALKIARALGDEHPPFIFFAMTASTIHEAIEAMREGAQDYIPKDDLKRIVSVVEREIREARIRREEKRATNAIRDLTDYDPITNLPTRDLFLKLLQTAMLEAQHRKASVAVLMVNLFQFKEISDAFGYPFGNAILKQAGERLKSLFPGSNYVSRLYENDFALIAPFTEPGGAIKVAEQIVSLLETSFVVQEIPIALCVRIGISVFPDHGTSADDLVHSATVAMHAAKATGDDYKVYSPSYNKKAAYKMVLMGDLRKGIAEGQLVLYYQPQMDLATKRIRGVEALVRWQHPQYGFLLPGEFIPTAENSGLLRPLTAWTIETCIQQIETWGPLAVPISVNLSGQDLLNYTLVHRVEKALKRANVRPNLLEFEITETALILSTARAKEILSALADLGIFISIDDFGSGYTSLGMLQTLPVHGVKLDQSMIRDLIKSKETRFTVVAVTDLAHHLGLSVTAEGVEDEATHDLLVIGGCDIGQGYLYGRPMPVEQLMLFLENYDRTAQTIK